MKHVIALAAALFTTSAFALSLVPENVNTNANTNAQNQGQAQGQQQGQLQAQGQLQGQGQAQGLINAPVTTTTAVSGAAAGSIAGASSGGNTQNVTVTDSGKVDYTGGYTVKNVPAVFSGNVYPTAPCMGSSQIGGAGAGFGVSFGTSWKDDECGLRETARSFSGMGLSNDALKILCTSQYAAAAPSCATVATIPVTDLRKCQPDPFIAKRTGETACK